MKLHFWMAMLLAPAVIYMGFKIRERSRGLGNFQIGLGIFWLLFIVLIAILQWRRSR